MIHATHLVPMDGAAPDLPVRVYLLQNSLEIDAERCRPLVIVCPGGGYGFRSFREDEPVAVRLLSLGFHACVIEYAVEPHCFPAALLQLLRAVAWAREHADSWHIDPAKIAVMGFSAGGHLAASAGVFWSRPHYARRLGLDPRAVRPDALILGYPVISSGEFAHEGSFRKLLGEGYERFRETVSLEKQVSADVPPTFVWHTWEDESVPVENTLLFVSALRRHGILAEVHVFSRGAHGLSLSSAEVYGPRDGAKIRGECAGWIDLAARWLREL